MSEAFPTRILFALGRPTRHRTPRREVGLAPIRLEDRVTPSVSFTAAAYATPTNNADKDFIAADQSPTSPFKNNLYVVWTTFSTSPTQVRLSRSTNNGLNWSAPIILSTSAENFVWPVDVRTAANGDVYVAYHSQP